nr:hypothetical protein GCM10017611_08230 [Rhodococcus wratislaviensis]
MLHRRTTQPDGVCEFPESPSPRERFEHESYLRVAEISVPTPPVAEGRKLWGGSTKARRTHDAR